MGGHGSLPAAFKPLFKPVTDENNCGQSGRKLQYRAIVFYLRKGIESTRPMAIISQKGGNR